MTIQTPVAGGEIPLAPGLTGLKELGGGESYEAWLAFDERLLAPVVVKIVRPHLTDDAATLTAYRRELEILSSLSHPGIARLFSYDDEAERPYLVIEHVDGPTLSALISRFGHLQEHQLLAVAVDLCSALHYVHGQGLCHLDLKPSNVVAGAPAKLIDFSVAMSADDADALTHPVGSDEYMAPEQCRPRERGRVGQHSDVWALGATLFRAAAGFRAFDREPRWAQLEDEPHLLPSLVDPALAELIGACLSPDPADRPTPRQISDRLDPLVADLPKARLSGFSIRL